MLTNADDKLIDTALSSEINLLSVFECNRLYPDILDRLIYSRTAKINAALRENPELQDFECVTIGSSRQKSIPARLNHQFTGDWSKLTIQISSDLSDWRNFFLQISWQNANDKIVQLHDKVNAFFNDNYDLVGQVNDLCPWSHWVGEPWNNLQNRREALFELYRDELTVPEQKLLQLALLFKKMVAEIPTSERKDF
jgi:hypothetical protein